MFFAQAAFGVTSTTKQLVTLVALAVSTILNAMYFIGQTINIYTPLQRTEGRPRVAVGRAMWTATVLFILLNLLLGIGSEPIFRWIEEGLRLFG